MQELLLGRRFDEIVVAAASRIVYPGERKKVVLDRAENARWIGIVAGYQKIRPGETDFLERVQVVTQISGIIRKKRTERVEKMTIHLDLGAESLKMVDILNEE